MTGWYRRSKTLWLVGTERVTSNDWLVLKEYQVMTGWYRRSNKLWLVCTEGTKYDFTWVDTKGNNIWNRVWSFELWTVPPICLIVQHSYQVLPATNYSLLTTNYSSIAYTGSVQDSFSIISSVITEAPCILMSQGCLPKVFQNI